MAHAYVSSGSLPLRAFEFSGGERTVAKILEALGFEVVVDAVPYLLDARFEIGRVYSRRRDIHAEFGGQQQGGISTPDGTRFIFLFTGEMGDSTVTKMVGLKGCFCMSERANTAIWSLSAGIRLSATTP